MLSCLNRDRISIDDIHELKYVALRFGKLPLSQIEKIKYLAKIIKEKQYEVNIIDEIYTQLALFIPQLRVTRENIKLEADRNKLYCNIKGINQIDFSTETFNLVLYDNNQ